MIFDLLGLGMGEYMRLEISRLGEFLVASVEGANIRPVSCVNSDVCSQVEVERKPFPTPLKCALKESKTIQRLGF